MKKPEPRKTTRPQKDQMQSLKIIVYGMAFMFLINIVFFEGFERFKIMHDVEAQKKSGEPLVVVDERFLNNSENEDAKWVALDLPQTFAMDDNPHSAPNEDYLAALARIKDSEPVSAPDALVINAPVIKKSAAKGAVKTGIKDPVMISGRPKIAIVIDDLGMNRSGSFRTIDLPAPLTLAFLPYAPQLDDITAKARDAGHELLIHVPMEPMSATMNPGPLALKTDMSEQDIRFNLRQIFKSFEGYAGINNHMGSRMTQDAERMGWVMEELAERDLIFVDSKTISTSVAGQKAAEQGLRFAQRHVFLDHEDSPAFVLKSLRKTEEVAKRQGYAIAIGHPKKATLDGLAAWLPDLEARGFELVPVSTLTRRLGAVKAPVAVSDSDPALPALPQIEPATY